MARRHVRLATHYRQPQFATAMSSLIDDLKAKAEVTATKEWERQAATDQVYAADGDLDDGIRDLYNNAELFDRKHPGEAVLNQLFPQGGFTAITGMILAQEPAAAHALATRVEELGTSHALFTHAETLRDLACAVTDALAAADAAVTAKKVAEAIEENAQGALRRQYEINYLDARRLLGANKADRLFPYIRSAKKPAEDAVPA
jgi:hypothetical protein